MKNFRYVATKNIEKEAPEIYQKLIEAINKRGGIKNLKWGCYKAIAEEVGITPERVQVFIKRKLRELERKEQSHDSHPHQTS